MKEEDMKSIADIIGRTLSKDVVERDEIRKKVKELAEKYPLYSELR